MKLLAVGIGGCIGALLRYELSIWMPADNTYGFPWMILGINGVGSFTLGYLTCWFNHTDGKS